MKMGAHEKEGEKLHLIDLKGPGCELQEFPPVRIADKDILPGVAPAGDVVAGVLVLDAQGLRHDETLPRRGNKIEDKDLTLLPQ
jgi:hypothetical protein